MSEDERLAGLQVGVTEAQAAAFAEMQQKAFRCEAAEAQLAKAREALTRIVAVGGLESSTHHSQLWQAIELAREALATGDET